MKISLKDLRKALNNKDKLLYTISSNEEILTRDACTLIKGSLEKNGYTFGSNSEIQAGFNWQEWEDSLASPSLFSPKEFHILNIKSLRANLDGLLKVIERLSGINNDRPALIITAPFLLPKDLSKAWVKYSIDYGCLVQCWPIQGHELPKWIHGQAKEKNLDLTIRGASIVATLCENNLLAADQAIKALSLAFEKKEIHDDDILDCLDNLSQFDAYKLVDAVLENNPKKAFRIFYNLKRLDVPISPIYYAFYREVNLLLRIREAKEGSALSMSELQGFGVWKKRQPVIYKAYNYFKPADLYMSVKTIERIDQALKGIINENPWDNLSLLINALLLNYSLLSERKMHHA